jgi:hypothetical protein
MYPCVCPGIVLVGWEVFEGRWISVEMAGEVHSDVPRRLCVEWDEVYAEIRYDGHIQPTSSQNFLKHWHAHPLA